MSEYQNESEKGFGLKALVVFVAGTVAVLVLIKLFVL